MVLVFFITRSCLCQHRRLCRLIGKSTSHRDRDKIRYDRELPILIRSIPPIGLYGFAESSRVVSIVFPHPPSSLSPLDL